MVNETHLKPTYLPTYLCDNSDGSDSSDNTKKLQEKNFFAKLNFVTYKNLWQKFILNNNIFVSKITFSYKKKIEKKKV